MGLGSFPQKRSKFCPQPQLGPKNSLIKKKDGKERKRWIVEGLVKILYCFVDIL